MTLPSLFEVCSPRPDVRDGRITGSDFAADLAQVINDSAPDEYKNPVKFFTNTHPTRGLKELLASVCQRLSGRSEQVGAIFRLDTNYGGGKTHALIALIHAVRHGAQVSKSRRVRRARATAQPPRARRRLRWRERRPPQRPPP